MPTSKPSDRRRDDGNRSDCSGEACNFAQGLVLFVLSFYLPTVALGDLLVPKAFSVYPSLLLTWRPRDSTTPVTSFLPPCTLPHLRRYPLKALPQLQHLVTLFTALSVSLPATPSYRVSDCLLHTARIVADARPAHASPLRPPAHRLTTRWRCDTSPPLRSCHTTTNSLSPLRYSNYAISHPVYASSS